MEDNKKFELNDDVLDAVSGGAASREIRSVTFNGVTWSVNQAVSVPYCSASLCSDAPYHNAVITGFRSPNRIVGYENTMVYLRMDCCKKEAWHYIKNLQPYKRITSS